MTTKWKGSQKPELKAGLGNLLPPEGSLKTVQLVTIKWEQWIKEHTKCWRGNQIAGPHPTSIWEISIQVLQNCTKQWAERACAYAKLSALHLNLVMFVTDKKCCLIIVFHFLWLHLSWGWPRWRFPPNLENHLGTHLGTTFYDNTVAPVVSPGQRKRGTKVVQLQLLALLELWAPAIWGFLHKKKMPRAWLGLGGGATSLLGTKTLLKATIPQFPQKWVRVGRRK